ncbi:MAG: cardiolipin synthase [Prosthecobacter sp.]|uniref:cardiolipin synthase n=1 Tax=Prosthecobacter sp. TaxID=1965333 RepID=UPI0019FAC20A|nr:cardiolipin synthase [Prosthecobacter sp.]MBE2287729.1 cardiolipin synthase [Prosthecobacter sp.]
MSLSFWSALHILLLACVALRLFSRRAAQGSTVAWLLLVVLVPFFGVLIYLLIGERRLGRLWMKRAAALRPQVWQWAQGIPPACVASARTLSDGGESVSRLARAAVGIPLMSGHRLQLIADSPSIMRSMIEDIDAARDSVHMEFYIWQAGGFVDALVDALIRSAGRGVRCTTLMDSLGSRPFFGSDACRRLREGGVAVVEVLPVNPLRMFFVRFDLRDHRKIMVVDGAAAFTGGMNIREGNMLSRNPAHPVHDLHFEVRGPVVAQIQRVFVEDWEFCTGETLEGPLWFPELPACGSCSAIGIVDGPDEDLEVMPAAFFAALNAAREEVLIMTPYFLPTATLMAALRLCAIRGVKVTILTPAQNNIPFVAWAAQTLYPELLSVGCRIFESPPPFDHAKFFLIDGVWSFLGSTNWDPRSLRLNFELNLACHDAGLGGRLRKEMAERLLLCREVTRESVDATPVLQRLRNGFARLFIPVL